jgi:hypothetical protein
MNQQSSQPITLAMLVAVPAAAWAALSARQAVEIQAQLQSQVWFEHTPVVLYLELATSEV